MPAAIPAPTATVTVPHGNGEVCWNVSADSAGNVGGESHPASMGLNWVGHWHIWSPTGQERGNFTDVGGDMQGQEQGFQSTQRSALVLWTGAGAEARRSRLDDGCASEAFFSATGGSLVLQRCGTRIKARRFDASATLVASAELGDGGAVGAVIDATGRALVVASSGSSSPYVARWFGPDLAPASAPFTLRATGTSQPAVRSLVGGGAAVQVDGRWVAVSASGVGTAADPPAWLAAHTNYDLQIIRGGTAYALIPRAGAKPHNALDLVAGNGDRCGSLTFPTEGLSMGPGGIVIGSAGDAGCTHSWWEGLLR